MWSLRTSARLLALASCTLTAQTDMKDITLMNQSQYPNMLGHKQRPSLTRIQTLASFWTHGPQGE